MDSDRRLQEYQMTEDFRVEAKLTIRWSGTSRECRRGHGQGRNAGVKCAAGGGGFG